MPEHRFPNSRWSVNPEQAAGNVLEDLTSHFGEVKSSVLDTPPDAPKLPCSSPGQFRQVKLALHMPLNSLPPELQKAE
jgi:hypothetical protein